MAEDIGLFEAIYSQRALRYFKPDPVDDSLIWKILDAGIRAPSGSNSQGWGFVVIRDPEQRRKIGEYSRQHPITPPPNLNKSETIMYRGALHLAEHMEDVPAYILVCQQTKAGAGPAGSSIYPTVQNILLAARGLGLASAFVTRQKSFEEELKRDLGMPDDWETICLLPLGYPDGVKYGPNNRRPVEEVTHFDKWGAQSS